MTEGGEGGATKANPSPRAKFISPARERWVAGKHDDQARRGESYFVA
jgi:hypothetical protein